MANNGREARKQRSNQAKAARLAKERRERRLKVIATVVVIAFVFGAVGITLNLTGDNDKSNSASSSSSSTTAAAASGTAVTAPVVPPGATITGDTPCPAADGSSPRTSSFAKAPSLCIDPAKAYTADFDTTQGHIVVALDTTKTPNTTNNFVVLSRYHYYDGTEFMRTNTSIDIVQGGAPSQTNSDAGPGYTIKDEGTPFTYKDGDLVMANTGSANSSGAQFFFGAGAGVSGLNSQGSYLNFGHVTSGLDVLHKILSLHKATDASSPDEGAPSTPVVINKLTITES